MNRNQLAQNIVEQMNLIRDLAEANNQHPMDDNNYAPLMQALSILSTLRDAEEFGHPLVRDELRYVACNGSELRVLADLEEARAFIATADELDARLFGTAIIEADPVNDSYRARA